MIDFISEHLQGHDAQVLPDLLDKDILQTLFFFNSGRSLHGYGLRLLTYVEWVSFMGTLLLLNLPNRNQIVDPRWVGHRLRAGYGALRWSFNTSHYLGFPRMVHKPLGEFSESDMLKWLDINE